MQIIAFMYQDKNHYLLSLKKFLDSFIDSMAKYINVYLEA